MELCYPCRMMKRYDTISPEETRKLYREMKKEQLASEYTLPKKPSSDGYYHLWIKDDNGRRQIKAKTIDGLKEKLYEKQGLTFRYCFLQSQEEKLKYVKNKEKRLSVQNTIHRNKKDYERFLEGTNFEEMRIDEITVQDIEELCLNILNGQDLTMKRFLSMRGLIKAALRYAMENYLVMDNVYDRVNFRKFNDMLVAPPSNEEKVHSDEEMENILDYLHKKQRDKPEFLPAYALELQIVMGLRRGEIPPLEWDDIKGTYIEISKEQITVMPVKEGGKETMQIVHHTKTYKDRRFPVTEEVENILERIKEVHDMIGVDSKYLFPADTPNGVIDNYCVYHLYRRICRHFGIKISRTAHKGTHSFRRNAITNTINKSNGNVLLASKLYGNTPEIAIKNYYTGLDLEEAKNILES